VESELKFKENKNKKWIFVVIGLIIGGVIGYLLPVAVYKLTYSVFDRKGADALFKEYFGDLKVKDAITKEVMIIAFSYNMMQPRFYSKFQARIEPEVYDVTMDLAVAASSSTPGYFYPKRYTNGNGVEELLVDGSIISNNPSLYAFIYA
jgi:patatin-like phospholipase/acyl hydrolase